jgi:hypothetical protein
MWKLAKGSEVHASTSTTCTLGIGEKFLILVHNISSLSHLKVSNLTIQPGHLFLLCLKKAIILKARYEEAFVKFNATFPCPVIDKWERMVSEWDADKKKKNPYEEPTARLCLCMLT